MKRILVYSHDTFGLGNIRRMLLIAERLAKGRTDRSVLIVSGSPMLHTFRHSPNIDYVKLPCLKRSVEGWYGASYLDISYRRTLKLRSKIIHMTAREFQPDLVLVDKKPLGVGQELQPMIQQIKKSGNTKLVLLLRDILDEPETTIASWQKNGYHEAVRDFYDRVLIAGSKDVYNAAKRYKFPKQTRNKTSYCGYVRQPKPLVSAASVTGHDQAKEHESVLVTTGGGEDGYETLRTYIKANKLVDARRRFNTTLVFGPELATSYKSELKQMIRPFDQITIKDFTDDLLRHMAVAKLIVCMGGYNTLCELLSLDKRAVVVPRVKPGTEQLIRAVRFEELGLLETIHPKNLSPVQLKDAILRGLAATEKENGYELDFNGLDNIDAEIQDLLSNPKERRKVREKKSHNNT